MNTTFVRTFTRAVMILLFLSPLIVAFLPLEWFPTGLDSIQQRMLALLLFAIVFWVAEPLPVFVTSVLIIFLQLVFLSDTSIVFVRPDALHTDSLIPHKDIFHSFASPVIMLFLGGFFLTGGATKVGLDRNLARIFLRSFGSRVNTLLLGIMFITAFFSLWMANTPVTAMMLAISTPVIAQFSSDDPGRLGFLLGIPIASSLGGIGTPVGTPVNAIALKELSDSSGITFVKWAEIGIPYVLVMTLISWWLLIKLFPSKKEVVQLSLEGEFSRTRQARVVYLIFPLTILLWLSSDWHGLNIYTVALVPVVAFLVSGVVTKNDLKKMSWDVLWLIAGGIALGLGLQHTGLTKTLISLVPFGDFSPSMLFTIAILFTGFVATIMSHTATANLLMPIMFAVSQNVPGLDAMGGPPALLFAVAVACSLGMALPISTPCNALAFASGGITNRDMMKGGGAVTLIGVAALIFMMFFVGLWF